MTHMTPSKIQQTLRIASMIMQLKSGTIVRGSVPQAIKLQAA